jgi:hypothetical protein
MKQDIVDGSLGKNAKYDVEVEGLALVAKLDYVGQFASAGCYTKIGIDQALRAIARAIPGELDDALVEGILAKLAAKQSG